jgi:hypothetical protein
MKSAAWPEYSFTEWLRPPDGWRTERAILSTYSAELFTALVALAGGNRDERSKLAAVEVIKAMDALRGRVRVLAQAGRVTAANKAPAALKLMDRFVKTIHQDASGCRAWQPPHLIRRVPSRSRGWASPKPARIALREKDCAGPWPCPSGWCPIAASVRMSPGKIVAPREITSRRASR